MSRGVQILSLAAALLASGIAVAAPEQFRIDPNHTHPLFEVDHFGISTWRGLFRSTTGSVTLDRERGTGTVDVVIDIASVDFGHDKLNQIVVGEKIGDWNGVSRPVTLKITSFKCIPSHPILKREVCGADASGTFNRSDFGVNSGVQYGFRQEVTLRIQVEAVRVE